MTPSLTFQLLPCAVEVDYVDAELERPLTFLLNSVEQPLRPIRTFRYSVLGSGPYEITEEGDFLDLVEQPQDVLRVLAERCYRRAYHLLALGRWTLVHAALVNVGGRRITVVGSAGTGKSTLSLHLLLAGYDVEGDEMVLVREAQVIAWPRRFRLKPGTEAIVPAFQKLKSPLPVAEIDGVVVAAFDPREAGYRWSLRLAPIDALVLAVPNHGGGSSLRALSPVDALSRLLPQIHRIDDSPAARARLVQTCSQLTRGGVYELQLGDLAEAVHALASLSTANPTESEEIPARAAS